MKSLRIFLLAALSGFVIQSFGQGPTNWVVRAPLPTAGQLAEISFNDGRFVLADASGAMLTSSDGQTWARTPGPPYFPRKIVYAQGKYVAITEDDIGGWVYTSTDGKTWTQQWQTLYVRDLLYVNGFFIVVTAGGVATSPDGVNWSQQVGLWEWQMEEVAYGNGIYVVVGSAQYGSEFMPLVLRSTNAVNWTTHWPPRNNNVRCRDRPWCGKLYAVTYGNGLFVANGGGGEFLTSPDGVNWAAHPGVSEPPLFPPIAIVALGFGNGYFVASSGNYIYYSTDGTNWTAGCLRCDGPSDRARVWANSTAFGNGRFITANREGSMYTSTDARNWSILRGAANLNAVAYGASKFVAVGDGSTVWSSFDGREWTYAFAQAKANWAPPNLYGVAFGNNLFVAVGSFGSIATSRDGLTWAQQEEETIGSFDEVLGAVAYGNGMFVAAGDRWVGPGATTRASKILVSSDGSNWTYATFSANSTGFLGAGYGNGTFVVVGKEGAIVTSPDGSNWTARASGTSQILRAVTFQNGRFFVGGDYGGTILTSTDGVNWGPSAPTSFANRGLGAGTGIVAVGGFQTEGRLHWSRDGLGWPGTSTSFPQVLNGAAWGEGSWVVVGNGGLILHAGPKEARLSELRFVNGAFEMTIETEPGVAGYAILASTNLADWILLRFVTSPPPTYVFRDETANTTTHRFYRVQ